MPLYEYKCNSCGDVFEVIQKFADEPLQVHEGCGGALERLLSPPAFNFKGSGWYVTDYGRNGSTKEAKSKSDSTKGEATKSSTPAAKESAPATKTE